MLVSTKKLGKEKEEVVEKRLSQTVQDYLKYNDHSGEKHAQALKSFTDHIIRTYDVNLVAVNEGSVIIIVECPTLESLEHLWSDYRAGHLDEVAERCLVTDEMKKELNLETICLKISIEEENYLNCKKALEELPKTCLGEYEEDVWKIGMLYTWTVEFSLSVSRMDNLQVVHGKNCSKNNYHHCHWH